MGEESINFWEITSAKSDADQELWSSRGKITYVFQLKKVINDNKNMAVAATAIC